MFTGIIRQVRKIKKISGDRLLKTLEVEADFQDVKRHPGDSIAIDGVCLTINRINEDSFSVEIMPETLAKTIIEGYKEGTLVNLENPLKIGDFLDGHFISGHADFVGKVEGIYDKGKTIDMEISFPAQQARFFAIKGSVTLNGVSLTISGLENNSFKISIIPETIRKTNLGLLKKGDGVNIEIDMLIRYLDSLLKHKEQEISYDFLAERGFI